MKNHYQITFIIFLVLLFACQQPQQQSSTEIEKEVKEQFNQLNAAINNSNSLAWSEFYSKDEFISTIVSTDFYAKRSAFIDSITYYFSLREYQHIEPLEVQVTVLTQALALMTSQETIEMRLKSGENINYKYVLTMLWKKEQDRWKIIHSHESWLVE